MASVNPSRWNDHSDVLQDIMVRHDGPSPQELQDFRFHCLEEFDLDQLAPPQPYCSWSSPDYSGNLFPQPSHDAWTHLRASTLPAGCHQTAVLPDPSFELYKPQFPAPSESGSIYFSDSGYGSTNGAPSLCHTAHTVDSYSSPRMSFKENACSEPMMVDRPPTGPPSGFVVHTEEGPAESIFRCRYTDCDWSGKCPSDKRKHEARHEKQFLCNEPGCTRKEGFGTANDLERHRKCVHRKEPVRGPRIVYKCFGKGCPRADKHWPRLDNFKQHLGRMHRTESPIVLLQMSTEWYQNYMVHKTPEKINGDSLMDDSTSELQSVGSAQPDEMDMEVDSSPMVDPHDHSDVTTAQDAAPKEHPSPSYPESSFLEGHSLLASLGPQLQAPGLHRDSPAVPASFKSEPSMANLPPPLVTYMTNLWNSQKRRSSQQSDEGIEMDSENTQLSQPDRQKLQQFFELALDQLAAEFPNAAGTNIRKDMIQCHLCDKKTRLPCEMKKHMKRHDRPYTCTFPHCYKPFGSKADWKRHETTQHLNESSWLCTSINANMRSPCGIMFYNAEIYMQHLSQQHCYQRDQIEMSMQSNRLDLPKNQGHFWCGFCRKQVLADSRGSSLLNERFDHIDTHHFKTGDRGDGWVFPDGCNIGGLEGRHKRKYSGQHSSFDRLQ